MMITNRLRKLMYWRGPILMCHYRILLSCDRIIFEPLTYRRGGWSPRRGKDIDTITTLPPTDLQVPQSNFESKIRGHNLQIGPKLCLQLYTDRLPRNKPRPTSSQSFANECPRLCSNFFFNPL